MRFCRQFGLLPLDGAKVRVWDYIFPIHFVLFQINGDDASNNFMNVRAAGERLKIPVLVPISELPERLRGENKMVVGN